MNFENHSSNINCCKFRIQEIETQLAKNFEQYGKKVESERLQNELIEQEEKEERAQKRKAEKKARRKRSRRKAKWKSIRLNGSHSNIKMAESRAPTEVMKINHEQTTIATKVSGELSDTLSLTSEMSHISQMSEISHYGPGFEAVVSCFLELQ